ncbi:GNAT family N-acetyltransferase, partial [Congregibacter sp.]|uniref:GNAT family N-acetyltransferase n=1 Tax=Congregibacter sp. TaxID=2744308 RepID=UPI00385DF3E8
WVATHKAGWEARTNVAYAITLSESGQLIGAIGLHNFEPLRAELGYWLGEPFWGDGYCTEAAKAMIKFSFKNLGLESVTAEHLSSNPASGGVMRKLGMTPVKKIRSQDRYGDLVDVEVYNITNKSQCEDSTHERY